MTKMQQKKIELELELSTLSMHTGKARVAALRAQLILKENPQLASQQLLDNLQYISARLGALAERTRSLQ